MQQVCVTKLHLPSFFLGA